MLTYQEMLAVLDRCTSKGGRWGGTDMAMVRAELATNYGFDDLQIQRVIFDMKDAGLIP